MKLKLGVIGVSEGNGHPYSWSAIFNGYNPEIMEECGYPVIPRYLEQQSWPESSIPDAEVVAVWTQDIKLSKHIASACNIDKAVTHPEDMLGMVDAVLLARDDAENHLDYARPFLEARLPIYIDKPLALSSDALEELYALEKYPGQIFTCSALRYSKELYLSQADKEQLGEIKIVSAFTPKSWDKYAVHIIEPVLNMLPAEDTPVCFVEGNSLKIEPDDNSGSLSVLWKSGIKTHFMASGDAMTPISIRVMGTAGWKDLFFSDSFSAFKAALEAFVRGIKTSEIASPQMFNRQVVELLERGRV